MRLNTIHWVPQTESLSTPSSTPTITWDINRHSMLEIDATAADISLTINPATATTVDNNGGQMIVLVLRRSSAATNFSIDWENNTFLFGTDGDAQASEPGGANSGITMWTGFHPTTTGITRFLMTKTAIPFGGRTG